MSKEERSFEMEWTEHFDNKGKLIGITDLKTIRKGARKTTKVGKTDKTEPMLPDSALLSARVTREEARQFQVAAAKADMKPSEYLRILIRDAITKPC